MHAKALPSLVLIVHHPGREGTRMWAKGTAGKEEEESGVAAWRETCRAEGDTGCLWGCSVGRRVR